MTLHNRGPLYQELVETTRRALGLRPLHPPQPHDVSSEQMEAERAHGEALRGDQWWQPSDTQTGTQLRIRTPLYERWSQVTGYDRDGILVRLDVSQYPLQQVGEPVTPVPRRFVEYHHLAQIREAHERAQEHRRAGFQIFVSSAALEQFQSRQNYWPRYDALPPAQPLPPSIVSNERTARSMELLWDWLSEPQRKELALKGYFTVIGEKSGKRYQVHKAASFGLKELDANGNVVCSFCVVPASTLFPAIGDTMLAQKVWIETDEEATLAQANRIGEACNARVE